MKPSAFIHPSATVDPAAHLGLEVKIWHHAHVMAGATIGDGAMIGHGSFVGPGARVGARVRVQNHVSIFDGVTLEDDVFVGPGAMFTNVRRPRAFVDQKRSFEATHVGRGATIGAGSVVVCPATIGAYAFVGAGAVVTEPVPPHGLVVGNPARRVGWVSRAGARLDDGPSPVCPKTGEVYAVDDLGCRPAERARPILAADPRAENLAIAPALHRALARVLAHGRYVLGPEVEAFEREVEAMLGVPHAVGVSSGTDALLVSLMALGIGAGDEVVTTPFSFVSTAEVIVRLGAVPRFVDVDEEGGCLDADALAQLLDEERAKGRRPKAILAVHLFGRPFDARIPGIAAAHGVPLVEDAAQALGAITPEAPVGGLGAVAAFSFFPTKNLGALGDGGLVTTTHAPTADRVRRLREHGAQAKYRFDELGGNFRLDALQAAFLREKLPDLATANTHRRRLATCYVQAAGARGLDEIVRWPSLDPPGQVFHQLVVRTSRRDDLAAYLRDHGVGTGVHYPLPLHIQGFLGAHAEPRRGRFPVAERLSEEVLALPMGRHVDEATVLRVIDLVGRFFAG